MVHSPTPRILRTITPALTLVVLLWLLLDRAMPVQAAGVVTDCSNDAQLRTMLTAGGDVSFDCGPDPVIIVISPTIALGQGSYSLDGGGNVTLSGANTNRIFDVSSGGFGPLYLTLTHIVLTNGYNAFGAGCIFISTATQVVLDDVTVQNCRSESDGIGGGIYHAAGGLTLKDSRVLSNTAGPGGGIRSDGGLILDNTLVQGNRAIAGAGGGLDVGGTALISGSTIYSNTAAQGGGGLRVRATGNVSVSNSQIDANSAPIISFGGGIYNQGTLTVQQTNLAGNRSTRGGAIYNVNGTLSLLSSTLGGNTTEGFGGGLTNDSGTATLTNVALNGNVALSGGGGILNSNGTANLTDVTLSGNAATEWGGGIFNYNGTLTLTNVTLSGNSARLSQGGGGLHNSNGTATLTNVTLSGNKGVRGGGMHNSNGTATLTNVTLSGNTATDDGGGIWHSGNLVNHTLTLKNTIVANSSSGGNCAQGAGSSTPITSNNFNLSSDNTCTPFFNKSADWNNENPILSPLGNHGGTTPNHVPFPPGKAVDGGSACPSPDQRGVPRPQGIACDIGAVEYVPGELAPWLWLPLIVR